MKGMAYTPFAVLATSMMFLMFISPLDVYPESVNQDISSVETAQTLDRSVQNSFSQGFGLTVNNHLQEFNNGLSNPISDAEGNFTSDYDPGSSTYYSLNQVESDLNSLFASETRRNLVLNTGSSYGFTASGLTIESTVPLDYALTDQTIGTNLTYNGTVVSQASIDGAKDPFAEFQAGEDVEYSYCGFNKPAYYAGSGASSSGSVISAEAVYKPENPGSISNKAEKVLFVASADEYDTSSWNNYAAVVVEDSSYNTGSFVNGFNVEGQINSGENVIIDQSDVYVSYFRQILDNKCFVESQNAPNVFDRMENNNIASDQGIANFVSNSSSSGQPNEDYIYYDGSETSTGPVVNITGINSNDNSFDERPWFNLDRDNLVDWNLVGLEE